MAGVAWEDEWELCNDDGFVYKRKKRRQESASEAVPPSAPPAPDPEAEERQRRERKKRTLMKLRDQYRKEIDRWDYLSNKLREMEERTRPQKQQPSSIISSTESPVGESSGTDFRPLINELLLQVEAQEKIVQNITNLCDVAEVMSKAQQESLEQCFFDLPVWATTPRTLMADLSEE